MEFTAEMIASFLGGEVVGDKSVKVNTIAKIEEGKPGALCFLSNPKYEPHIYTTGASVVIVNRDFNPAKEVRATLVKVDDAYGCFAKLLEMYAASKPKKTGQHPSAVVDDSASVPEDCYLGAYAVIDQGVKIGTGCQVHSHVYVGDNVTIGRNVTIHAGARIYEQCVIGDDCIIHSGAVIGADGFGFAPNDKGEYVKIPQLGNVVLGNRVEIGANTCIDRATMGSTVIADGVKLDNLIQVGHNVTIGSNTVIAAQVGIAGSTKVGKNCMFGGQVGIAGHLEIGDKVMIGSQSGISNNIPADSTYFGYPAMPGTKYHRSHAIFRNLPQLSAEVRELRKEIEKLKEK